jgi:NOL1/NOP2/fmu family ribosome biogenesis protein
MTREIQFIFKSDKEKLIEKLKYYGITKLDFLLSVSGREKIRGYTGSLTTNDIIKLDQEIGIDLLGLYLFHSYENDDNLRLSFDAIFALKDQITKNILDLSEEQAKEFLKGNDILLTDQDKQTLKDKTKGFKIIRLNKKELIGTAKLTEDRIINYMPKERRLR